MDIMQLPELKMYFEGADHIDIKSFEGEATLREFIARALSYSPGWMRFLYGVRGVFVRLLGMKQESAPQNSRIKPEDVSFTPGEMATFFKVDAAQEDYYWVACAAESHLTAYISIVMEPLTETRNRFYIVTIVHYNRWTGPVYFNVIRPFHHLVVNRMGHAALK